MNKTIAVGVGLLLLVLLLLFSTTYTVKYNEVAVKATFGQTDEGSIVTEPGLHYRLPVFIDKITKLDTRLQLVEAPLEEVMTSDGLQIVARAFLMWRVDTEGEGPLEFFKSYGSVDGATFTLRNQFRTAFTGSLSRYRFNELLGEQSQLDEAEAAIQAAMVTALADRGVEPVAVGISQLVLPPKTSSAVLQRMQATRDVLAEAERNIGRAQSDAIRNQGRTVAEKIKAFASQRAEEIRALGNERAQQYVTQMSEEEGLATFLIWLDTLERALSQNTTVILPADFSPFHLMAITDDNFSEGIPMPARAMPRFAPAAAEPEPDPPARVGSETLETTPTGADSAEDTP
ncbi:MAG: hypothetical protein HKO59_16630 [Phycisphaerales bacterium]|nr:hypothetical protein [Phycisphaerae bacterium]NNF42179.1 hypothetical protein [Phycisphaerales bacterium]NNM27576.1 hypothetical protein [Phycisphaerales bacterium]